MHESVLHKIVYRAYDILPLKSIQSIILIGNWLDVCQ